jgi:hypothetical protein
MIVFWAQPNDLRDKFGGAKKNVASLNTSPIKPLSHSGT